MAGIDAAGLNRLDSRGYTVLEAITDANLGQPSTFSRPNAFICVDGKTYWVKGKVQQGLVAELISGRLASRIHAGPIVRIIRVTPEVLPRSGMGELVGVVVGSEDLRGTENARNLEPFIKDGTFQPGLVSLESRGRVIVFQTWIGASDSQVLIELTTGSVYSIDHGDCFGTTSTITDPQVIVTEISGVPADAGREAKYIMPTVGVVESVTDEELLEAVSRIPTGDEWRSPIDRRIEIASWLSHRRNRIREVMSQWVKK